MQKKRIMFIFGTRPEAIKMAPLVCEVKKHDDIFEAVIIVTAQHREMLDQSLKSFNLKPDYDMEIMEAGQSISSIVTKTLQGFEEIVLRERPDIILVQGDTSTSFAAALGAYYHKIPVGHVEAGLRTHNKFNPYPEEMNRRLTADLSALHFAPTSLAVKNLEKEGIHRNCIYLTGNTVIDALLSIANEPYDLKKLKVDLKKDKKMILVTTHRRESFGLPMRQICEAISKIVKKYHDMVSVVIPVHKNPLVKDVIHDVLGDLNDVILIEPLDYMPFVHLMKKAYIILTDSGGIQEEAPSLGKPVLVLRDVTERPEAVLANTVRMVGTDVDLIFNETEKLLLNHEEYTKMARAVNPYGDGKASSRIVAALLWYFGFTDKTIEEFNPQIPSLQS